MGNRAKTGIKEHIGADKRRDMLPTKYITDEVAEVIMSCIEKGKAIICVGSENSPIEAIQKGIHKSMWVPCNNGVALYDNSVPFRKQYKRDIITIYINDFGSETYIDSIKELNVKRVKVLYKYLYKTQKRG